MGACLRPTLPAQGMKMLPLVSPPLPHAVPAPHWFLGDFLESGISSNFVGNLYPDAPEMLELEKGQNMAVQA